MSEEFEEKLKTWSREMGLLCFAVWVCITIAYGSLWLLPQGFKMIDAYAAGYGVATVSLIGVTAGMFGLDKIVKYK